MDTFCLCTVYDWIFQSTWLSRKLKVSVQGKVTDSLLFYFKTNTWKGVLVWDYGEWFWGLFTMN